MTDTNVRIGFLGAGGIARAHAYALNSLKYYYPQSPEIIFEAVSSARKESREEFARFYKFNQAISQEEFFANENIDSVFILGPNKVHFEHFKAALEMKNVKRIYLEKPVCSGLEEEQAMHQLLKQSDKSVQIGFQYLQTSAVREALAFWKSGKLGKAIHFDLKYYHGDYLQSAYREKRVTRLTPAPDGGAMADLGSHGISLLCAFFGNDLRMTHAMQSGTFEGVPAGSDLFSLVSLVDPQSKAVGTLSASRISSGSGDLVSLEIYAEKGCLKYASNRSEYFDYYLEETGQWTRVPVGSNYPGISSFPSGHVPPGWLRSMVHSHYLFLGGNDQQTYIPNLEHGLAVQRLVRETAEHLAIFRENEL